MIAVIAGYFTGKFIGNKYNEHKNNGNQQGNEQNMTEKPSAAMTTLPPPEIPEKDILPWLKLGLSYASDNDEIKKIFGDNLFIVKPIPKVLWDEDMKAVFSLRKEVEHKAKISNSDRSKVGKMTVTAKFAQKEIHDSKYTEFDVEYLKVAVNVFGNMDIVVYDGKMDSQRFCAVNPDVKFSEE